MKAPAFEYARATSVDEALAMLVLHGDRAKVVAGGQSLFPMLNLRLIAPEVLVDISELKELRGMAVRDGVLHIGAATRHVELLQSRLTAAVAPLLVEALKQVAHPAIRNRGTIGGSLAHADPAAELPACMVALDATIVVRGPAGKRRIAADEFFQGLFATAISAQELIVSIELPISGPSSTHFFQEFARRAGDYAMAGIACQATRNGSTLSSLRMAFFAVSDRPLLAKATAGLLNTGATAALISQCADAFGAELGSQHDQRVSSELARHLACVLFRRCAAELTGVRMVGVDP